ncbi:DUF2750 domain-containing protein [Ralstonia pseudosolanacearum]|uniref:DUF2750 domain-containing protein n=1 Tax=Ralstonia pseudosolanacearum TaxID=1310165 RepID=UPI001FF8D775|nr:DUF2750 domain-containing protein [Ralstonia pseudosolanacearum]
MSTAAAQALAFYREVASSGLIWSIRDDTGFPAPFSRDGKRAMPFWSSESRALAVIRGVAAYEGFLPVAISWRAFCDRWVPGLIGDDLLAGVNWSGLHATGFDIEPSELQHNVDALCGVT